MERKEKVLNVRVSDRQRAAYERAAAVEGTTVSALVTTAADARAEEILRSVSTMTMASDVFDELLAGLDRPGPLAPSLDKALSGPRFKNR